MIVVNPVGAGGLTLSKLALANAVAANMLSGKKFYSGDKVLKTRCYRPYKFQSDSISWTIEGGS